ncbi:transposase, IS4 [Streptomyces sp. e14]|nr:transposase, IS4 [Streptomyces sp. e14]
MSGVFFGVPLLATAALTAPLTMLNVVESGTGVTDRPTAQTPSSCCGAMSTTPPPSARSSTASASRPPLRADLARHRCGCWATKRIPAGQYATCCGTEAPLPRSPNAATRWPTADDVEPTAARPPAFDKDIYRNRNVVERCFAHLKQFRAIATRFDKLADRYRAGIVLAALILWLRESTG